MKSQELPVPPPPENGQEHAEPEPAHEAKPGQAANAERRNTADSRLPG